MFSININIVISLVLLYYIVTNDIYVMTTKFMAVIKIKMHVYEYHILVFLFLLDIFVFF